MALISHRLGLGKAWEEGDAHGRAAAKVDAILTVLRVRNLAVNEQQLRQLEGCRDLALLEQWLARAVTVASADELFAR